MATAKVVNYTAEQTAAIVEAFQNGIAIEAIATQVGKSVRSVVAKLSREGAYKAKAKTAAESRVTKADLIAKIAKQMGVEVTKLESLEKATKEALEALVQEDFAE